MKFLSLFAGIGGFDLGLERAGWECVGQVEIDPFCQKVLAKHWPNVWRWNDVRSVTAELVYEHCGRIDAIVGGFPCQDISTAGKGAGIDGERSGLWSEIFRLVREIRPRFVVVENVATLLSRGMGRVLGDLASCGYDAEWDVFSASACGAWHSRKRIFIVAYPNGNGLEKDASHSVLRKQAIESRDAGHHRATIRPRIFRPIPRRDTLLPEPSILGISDGLSRRMDVPRLKALGNAIVPQVAEVIGRAILRMVEGEEWQ